MSEKVKGNCPMGCGGTLFLGSGGYVTCAWSRCPNPTAMADLMLDHAEAHHVVNVGDETWTIQHPMRERLNGELFECPLHTFMAGLSGPDRKPGRYIVHGNDPAFHWVWCAA